MTAIADIHGYIVKVYPNAEKNVTIYLDIFGNDVADDIPEGRVIIHYED